MKISQSIAGILALAVIAFTTNAEAKQPSPNIGFEQVLAPVPHDGNIAVSIWYPSTSDAMIHKFGFYDLDVAVAGVPIKKHLPLIIMSHGTGGYALGHITLAVALAKAGFVVAAVEHRGDNFHDQSRAFTRANFASRAQQISAALDFLTGNWHYKKLIDPIRIGMFGHSAGGATSLIIGGGVLDWGQVVRFCVEHPEDWGCVNSRKQNPAQEQAMIDMSPIAAADRRVKALVIAAPALTHGFAPAGLAKLKIPVQLWVAGKDEITPDARMLPTLMTFKPEQHDIPNAGHLAFLPPCPEKLRAVAQMLCTDPQGFDREAFHQDLNAAIVRFFRDHLRK